MYYILWPLAPLEYKLIIPNTDKVRSSIRFRAVGGGRFTLDANFPGFTLSTMSMTL
jgi:hypothetical protein